MFSLMTKSTILFSELNFVLKWLEKCFHHLKTFNFHDENLFDYQNLKIDCQKLKIIFGAKIQMDCELNWDLLQSLEYTKIWVSFFENDEFFVHFRQCERLDGKRGRYLVIYFPWPQEWRDFHWKTRTASMLAWKDDHWNISDLDWHTKQKKTAKCNFFYDALKTSMRPLILVHTPAQCLKITKKVSLINFNLRLFSSKSAKIS